MNTEGRRGRRGTVGAGDTPVRLAVSADGEAAPIRQRAAVIARDLKLELVELDAAAHGLLLVVTAARLELRATGESAPGGVFVDFVGGRTGRRRTPTSARRQPIALAVGVRHGLRRVLDATAGLGADAFLLASLGCQVTAVERSRALGLLLQDGVDRAIAGGGPGIWRVLDRCTFVTADSRSLMLQLADDRRPEVIYMDPMYPPSRKATALPRKEIRLLRMLVGCDVDSASLFDAAMSVALRRVVVKRDRFALPLHPRPALSYGGKIARYDVYLTRSGGAT